MFSAVPGQPEDLTRGEAATAAADTANMAPPLLQLKDVTLTFGGTPLLSFRRGAVRLLRRTGGPRRTQWIGQIDPAQIAAGQIKPDRGSVFTQPGAVVRYLPQEPNFLGFASTLAYVEAGLGPSNGTHLARKDIAFSDVKDIHRRKQRV